MNININETIEYLFKCNEEIQILPSKEALIEKLKLNRPLKIKLGIDPTSSDLHLGHTVCLQMLKRFQDLGHEILLLIGGFTACLGDPTGRNETRPPLTQEQVEFNAKTYIDQVSKILDLSKTKIVNNIEWLQKITLSDMIKILGHNTVNQLIAKDAFGTRIEQGLPLYMHELIYPILQGYDSVELKADIELGGHDQRFNVLMGRDLQKSYNQPQQIAILLPLLIGLDGQKKMSKTYNNYIGINDTPSEIYGKIMSLPDELLIDWFTLVVNISINELNTIKQQLENHSINPRDIKMLLAKKIIIQYHDNDTAIKAEEDFIKKFQKREIPEDIDELDNYDDCNNLVDILLKAKMVESKGEGKRKIKEGAVKINGEKITEEITINELKKGDIIQLGKRKFIKLK